MVINACARRSVLLTVPRMLAVLEMVYRHQMPCGTVYSVLLRNQGMSRAAWFWGLGMIVLLT